MQRSKQTDRTGFEQIYIWCLVNWNWRRNLLMKKHSLQYIIMSCSWSF